MDPQAGASSPDHIIGQTVGNYLVTQKLGEGGMGSVYLAEHPTIGKKVALKILHAEFASNPEVADRFFTEAKAVNAIGHPNIVDIVDYGVIQSGPGGRDRLVYFIMEYLHGQTLSNVVRTESPLPPERALTIALQVADALAASHKSNIVHRDLKPDNIILVQRGRERDFVKLLDFGIAKLTGSDGMSSHKTRTGLVLGTPAYMSPEQCEGRSTVDHRTDIYALGVVLYEMLVGRVPFVGEGYGEILVQHLTQQPVPPSQYRMMSPHVEQVVLKALEKRPDMRFPTMDEFMRAMSDPVGFVDSHGGITGFIQRQLLPSNAPLPSARFGPSLTPIGLTGMGMVTPVPGSLTPPSPTTLGAAAGQVQPTKSKTPFLIAAGVTVVLAIGAVVLLASKKNESSQTGKPIEGSAAVVANDKGSQQPPPPPPIENKVENKGSAPPPVENKGSAPPPVENKGSAPPPVENKGSALPPPPVENKGSALPPPPVENPAALAAITITSNPPGAEIRINGASIGKKTPATLNLPKGKDVAVTLRLTGHADFKKSLVVDQDTITFDAPLRKVSGKGNPKGPKQCDTCLERPD